MDSLRIPKLSSLLLKIMNKIQTYPNKTRAERKNLDKQWMQLQIFSLLPQESKEGALVLVNISKLIGKSYLNNLEVIWFWLMKMRKDTWMKVE